MLECKCPDRTQLPVNVYLRTLLTEVSEANVGQKDLEEKLYDMR